MKNNKNNICFDNSVTSLRLVEYENMTIIIIMLSRRHVDVKKSIAHRVFVNVLVVMRNISPTRCLLILTLPTKRGRSP